MTDSGPNPGGSYSYQKGVWMSKGGSVRSEKYQKWTEDRTKSQVQQLDRQKHSSLVKLNGECLQVRNELRGLQHERHQFNRSRQGSAVSADGAADFASSISLSSTSSAATGGNKGLRKSTSFGSLASSSSGYSSLSSSSSVGKRSSGAEMDGVGGRGKGPGPGLKGLNPNTTALKLKNLHSARALSKLNNDMDISH